MIRFLTLRIGLYLALRQRRRLRLAGWERRRWR